MTSSSHFKREKRNKNNKKRLSPDFGRVRVFLTSGSVGVNVFEILFGLDTGQDADDGSGSDEENTIVLVSAHHQIGIVVEIHIQATTQRIAKRRRRNARNILRFQNLFLFTSKLKLRKKEEEKLGERKKTKLW